MFIIPTVTTNPAFKFQITLDATVYVFQFRWNGIGEFWTFDILNLASEGILYGQKIIINYPLIKRYANPLLPPGEIIAIDTSSNLETVGRNDLGGAVKLVYVPLDEYDGLI